LLAAIALLWPNRISGPLDGVPLETTAEAVLVGVVFPALGWFHPRFLATRLARVCVIMLLSWKAFTAIAVVQDGWCAKFVPAAPFVTVGTGTLHSWDMRADWRSANPSCSAVVTRSYNGFSDFPAWFLNLSPPNDIRPAATDRPPGATVAMTVDGFLSAPRAGVLQIITAPDVAARVYVDEGVASIGNIAGDGVPLTRGIHRITVDAKLTGDRWRFVPLWNGADLWSQSIATLKRPSRVDLAVRPWGRWIVAALVAALGIAWLASAVARIGDPNALAWAIGASSSIGFLAAMGHENLVRWLIAGLLGAAFLPVPTRLRNVFGAFTLIGIPWLTLIVVVSAPLIGRFTLYTAGDDYWTFQRFAYRIFMQGYWLEGGSVTFWFQPLYRWIAGALHMIFGDSSVGEWYWDGACVLATALFSFHVAKAFAGFRWGLVAAVMTLGVFTLGTTWVFVGRGLSEISSAGLICLAALFAWRSRHGHWRWALAAGVVATLGFYTRLNNLPMAFAVVLCALPVRQPVRTAFGPRVWLSRASWQTAACVSVTLCLGLLLFAWRTWHYTGVFSVFYGTQRELLAVWQPGISPTALLTRMTGSIMMLLTMNDPARFDPHAVPILAGALVSVLAAAGVPGLRELPLGPVLLCLASMSGALITRGSAYPGRFSIHVIAVACTVVVCTAALMSREVRQALGKSPDNSGARTC
jgi:hypothetical protein